jgi:hypothetical protein
VFAIGFHFHYQPYDPAILNTIYDRLFPWLLQRRYCEEKTQLNNLERDLHEASQTCFLDIWLGSANRRLKTRKRNNRKVPPNTHLMLALALQCIRLQSASPVEDQTRSNAYPSSCSSCIPINRIFYTLGPLHRHEHREQHDHNP